MKKGSGATVYSKETLKTVLKSVVAEEDRSRNRWWCMGSKKRKESSYQPW